MTRDRTVSRMVAATDTVKELLGYYILLVLVAAVLLMPLENMAFKDALWMTFVTATSTGYGDLSPKTTGGRMVAVVMMHLSLFVVIPLLTARLAARLTVDSDAFTHAEQEAIRADLRAIREALSQRPPPEQERT